MVEVVGEGCCCWFVDDVQNFEVGDVFCVFGCLVLGIVEVGWYCDDCFVD